MKHKLPILSLRNKLLTIIILFTFLWTVSLYALFSTVLHRYEANYTMQKEQIIFNGMETRLSDFQMLLDSSINDIMQSEALRSFINTQTSTNEEFVRKAFGQIILDMPEIDKIILIGENSSFIFSLAERMEISFRSVDLENILYNSYGEDIHYDNINYIANLSTANAYSLESDMIVSLLQEHFTYLKRFPSQNWYNASLLIVLKDDFAQDIAGTFHQEYAKVLEHSEPLLYLQKLQSSVLPVFPAISILPHFRLLFLSISLLTLLVAVLTFRLIRHPALDQLHTLTHVAAAESSQQSNILEAIENISDRTVKSEFLQTFLLCCFLPAIFYFLLAFVSFGAFSTPVRALSQETLLSDISTFNVSYARISSRISAASNSASTRLLFEKSEDTLSYDEYFDASRIYLEIRSKFQELENISFYTADLKPLYTGIYFDAPILSLVSDQFTQKLKESNSQIIPLEINTLSGGGFRILFGMPIITALDDKALGYITFSISTHNDISCDTSPLFLAYTNLLTCSENQITFSLPDTFSRSISRTGELKEVVLQSSNDASPIQAVFTPISNFWIGYFPLPKNTGFFQFFKSFFIGTAILSCLIDLLFAFISIHFFFNLPLQKTYLQAKNIYKKQYTPQDSPSQNEFSTLLDYFQYLLGKIQHLSDENLKNQLHQKELEYAEKDARLNALIQQINPHFLYNTLEIIKWNAYELGAQDIVETTIALSKLYQHNIIKGDPFVPLSNEIEILQNYIFIQQKRFPEVFEFFCEISEDVRQIPIPRLILQPLVENSIEHGFYDLLYPGKIEIEACRHGDFLQLSVRDNGKGISPDRMASLKAALACPESASSSGQYVALCNISQRLHLYYNGQASIELSCPGQGTSVLILFPLSPTVHRPVYTG